MVTAYILIEMAVGHSREMVNALRKNPAVKDVEQVTGPYDLIAVLEAPGLDEISEILAREIHSLPGVARTTTCVSLKH